MIFKPKAIENQHLTSNKCHFHAFMKSRFVSLCVCACARVCVCVYVSSIEVWVWNSNAQLLAYILIIIIAYEIWCKLLFRIRVTKWVRIFAVGYFLYAIKNKHLTNKLRSCYNKTGCLKSQQTCRCHQTFKQEDYIRKLYHGWNAQYSMELHIICGAFSLNLRYDRSLPTIFLTFLFIRYSTHCTEDSKIVVKGKSH